MSIVEGNSMVEYTCQDFSDIDKVEKPMKLITKRNGKWWTDFYHTNPITGERKRHRKSTKLPATRHNYEEACKIAFERKYVLSHPPKNVTKKSKNGPKVEQMTFEELALDFLQDCKN